MPEQRSDQAAAKGFPGTTDTYNKGGPWDPEARSAAQDQGIWTMTDAEFGAELDKEFEHGFREARATNGLRDSALLFIGAWVGVVVTLLIFGLTGAIK